MGSLVKLTKYLRKKLYQFSIVSLIREQKEAFLIEASITIIAKSDKNIIRKGNYRPVFLMYIHVKTLRKY